MFQMSSGAIIFKLHFWEHAEKLKHLHVQIAFKNERRGNEKARIYGKAVTRGFLCAGGAPLMNLWVFQKWLGVICEARFESFGFKSPSNNLQIKTGGFSLISKLSNLNIASHKKKKKKRFPSPNGPTTLLSYLP